MSPHEQPQSQSQSQSQPKPKKQSKDPSLEWPSERNIRIYEAVRIGLRTQTAVAAEFGITQPCVSQILRRVAPFYDRLFPGDELGQRLKESKRSQRIDYECYQRRKKHYRQAELAWEQSQHPLVNKQWTFAGKDEDKNLKKTVITERDQRISLESVKVQERINDKIERSGWGRERSADCGVRNAESGKRRKGKSTAGQVSSGTPFEKLPLPEGLREADRPLWPKLLREEQEQALDNLTRWPGAPLEWLKLKPGDGPIWSYYPWRTEAEYNSALLADLVLRGQYTIEEYLQQLEILELSKPFAHPNLLRKDHDGDWQMIDPQAVPLPVTPPDRAVFPAGSPERVYWPYKSRAEHYAMLRAEMVLRGHLSLDQYDSLNAWASWYMNEKYPDPLENVVRTIIAPGLNVECGLRNAEWEASKAPTSGRGVGRADVPCSSTLTAGQGFDSEASKAPTSGRGVGQGNRILVPGKTA